MRQKLSAKVVREFEFEGLKLVLVEPTAAVLREAKFRYHRKYTEALKEGYYTRGKMMALHKTDDVKDDVFETHEVQRREILQSIITNQKKLEEALAKEDAEAIRTHAAILTLYRNALIQEDNALGALFESTVEQLAQDERLLYLTYGMIKTTEKESYWENYDDFLNEESYSLVEACKYQVMCWDYNLDPGWQDTLPESEALRKLEELEQQRLEREQKDQVKEGSTEVSDEQAPKTKKVSKKKKASEE